jgi:hypothetical protein
MATWPGLFFGLRLTGLRIRRLRAGSPDKAR